jgi:hypothetical protein
MVLEGRVFIGKLLHQPTDRFGLSLQGSPIRRPPNCSESDVNAACLKPGQLPSCRLQHHCTVLHREAKPVSQSAHPPPLSPNPTIPQEFKAR